MTTEFDTRMMARALQLARRGIYSAMPNPHVGCVLTRDSDIIGEGITQPVGGDHAEVQALHAAGDARGATAYVSLEPCSHQGYTGPCADALVAAGVTRVVLAMLDPNPLVSGQGVAKLRAAGVAVDCGLLESEARAIIPGFVSRMTRDRGRWRAKLAMSLDGRTAMASGESQWITGAAARADVQRLRAMSCAVVTGIGTVLADDCALTVRPEEWPSTQELKPSAERQPLRVVLDSTLRTPPEARVLDGRAPTLLCHADDVTPPEHISASAALRLELPRESQGLELAPLVEYLTARQCNEILVESGPRLAGALLQYGLLDELIVYMAPTLLGSAAQPLLSLPLQYMTEQLRFQTLDVRRIGDDWRLTLVPQAPR